MIEPFSPIRSMEELVASPQQPTGSLLLDAIMKVVNSTQARNTKQVADIMKVDRKKLCGAFELLTGGSLQELLELRCIRNIEHQLKETTLTLQEIARTNGFATSAALTHFFQRFHSDVTPLEFRSGRRWTLAKTDAK